MIRTKILLIENEPVQAKELTKCVLHLGLHPLGPVVTMTDALELCQHDWPDLAIIGLRPSNAAASLDLATQLGRLRNMPIVFLYENISDDAILERMAQMQPLAVLPKPYKTNALQQIIQQGLSLSSSLSTTPLLGPTLAEPRSPINPWFYVRERGMLVRVAMMDIACVHMDQQYAVLATTSGRRHSVRMTLAEVLTALSITNFVQCHRSWVVNLHHIERVDPTGDTVWLVGGAEAALGRAYRQRVLQQLTILG